MPDVRVVVAPDSFGGTLSSPAAARAIADGWRRARPDDRITTVALSDGGEGLLEAIRGPGDERREVEVADPLGRPRTAAWLLRADGSAIIESAEACGLTLLEPAERDPRRTSTYGAGQLLEAARGAGAASVAVGLGGSATVDGGVGAMLALGFRVTRTDGHGTKIGGRELATVTHVEPRWVDDGWSTTDVEVWADVTTPLGEAAELFAPQKGADPPAVRELADGLDRWADVVEGDLGGVSRDLPGTGAAGGLGFGLVAALGARIVPGAAAVAEAVGLEEELEDADLVVTGEGSLDETTGEGKVVGHVVVAARRRGIRSVAVVGRRRALPTGLVDVEESAPGGAGPDPADEVARAAERLAARTDP